MKTNKKKHVAFFDLDNTILNSNSGKILILQAFKKGLINKNAIIQALILSVFYRIGLLSPERIMKKMASWLKGVPENQFIDFARNTFSIYIKNAIREQARKAIKYHKQNNGHTVILSAATHYICNPVKDVLEIDDVICSKMEVIDGYFSGYPEGEYCYGKEKLIRTKAYCETHNFDIDEAYYYADSISDLNVLEKVGNPMCVSPDAKLIQVAEKRRWQMFRW